LAALEPAPLDDSSAGAGSHAAAEPMLPLAASLIWLVSVLHDRESQSEGLRSKAVGYERARRIVKGSEPCSTPSLSVARHQSRKEAFIRERKKSAKSGATAVIPAVENLTTPLVISCVTTDYPNQHSGAGMTLVTLLAFLNTSGDISYTRSAGWRTNRQLSQGF